MMNATFLVVLLIVLVFVVIFTGLPVTFAMGGLATLFALAFLNPATFSLMYARIWLTLMNFMLVAVPMFVFMGSLMEHTGIGDRLFKGVHVLAGGLNGGLAIATIVICTLLAASTGIVGSGVVIAGLMALPSMLKHNYDKRLAVGTCTASGTLGILIPPSIMLVTWGAMTGFSVGKLFFGAFIPGILVAVLFIIYVGVRCYLQPSAGRALPVEERRKISTGEKIKMFLQSVLLPVLLVLVVLGSIFFGVATPTQAAGLGALATILLAVGYRTLTWPAVSKALMDTVRTTSMIGFLFFGSLPVISVFLAAGGMDVINNALAMSGLGYWGVIAIMEVIILIMGCFVDWVALVVVATAIFVPIAIQLGCDPLWFAIITCLVITCGFLTPPFGGSLFYMKGISPSGINMNDIIMGSLPFMLMMIIAIVICMIFPQLVTWLPGLMIE